MVFAFTVLALSLMAHHASAQGPSIVFGRPCTLVGDPNKGANDTANKIPANEDVDAEQTGCTYCGSGSSAVASLGGSACALKPVVCPPGQTLSIFYYGSNHELFAGPTKCSFPGNPICPNDPPATLNGNGGCKFPCPSTPTWINDQANGYCVPFNSNFQVTPS